MDDNTRAILHEVHIIIVSLGIFILIPCNGFLAFIFVKVMEQQTVSVAKAGIVIRASNYTNQISLYVVFHYIFCAAGLFVKC